MSNDERFSHVESAARRLIEGFFDRISGEQLDGGNIARRLAQSFESLVNEGKAKHTNKYRIHLHPDDCERITKIEPKIESKLSNWLPELAAEIGVMLVSPPQIILYSDPIVRPGRVLIRSEIDPSLGDGKTRAHNREAVENQMLEIAQSRKGWLIINGQNHVDLDQLIIHIGRRPDNEIVIESSTISRVHAQIRWRFNHFRLYDMGSRAGVIVNGEKVDECVLQPGDVIQLAEISLVYGEGSDDDQDDLNGIGDTTSRIIR